MAKRRVLILRVEVEDDRSPEELYELLSEGMDALGATDEEHPEVVSVSWGRWIRNFRWDDAAASPTPRPEEEP